MFKYFELNKIFSITSKAPKYVLLLFIIVQTNFYELINSNYDYAFQNSLALLRRQLLYPAELRKQLTTISDR